MYVRLGLRLHGMVRERGRAAHVTGGVPFMGAQDPVTGRDVRSPKKVFSCSLRCIVRLGPRLQGQPRPRTARRCPERRSRRMGPSSLTTGANIFSAPVRINLTETSDPASPCLVPFPPTHCEEMSLRGAAAAALLLLQPLLARITGANIFSAPARNPAEIRDPAPPPQTTLPRPVPAHALREDVPYEVAAAAAALLQPLLAVPPLAVLDVRAPRLSSPSTLNASSAPVRPP